VSISERKCISLLTGVVTFGAVFTHDGNSFLYAVASRGEVTIYRQPWKDGKNIGASQVALNHTLKSVVIGSGPKLAVIMMAGICRCIQHLTFLLTI
jgi:hypothetical protein